MKNLKTTDSLKDKFLPMITFLLIIIIWQVVIMLKGIPSYVLPSPKDILDEFLSDWETLLFHSKVTVIETIFGLLLSVIITIFIGIIMDFVPIIKKCFYPMIYLTQMIPTITIAPLLVIWFGFGIKSKVLCVVLTCFFPMLVNFMDVMEHIEQDYINLFKIMKSNKWKTFIHLKFPMAMDNFFTGLKISGTYAFIAATVSEWLGGTAGLGVYMVRAKSSYALDKVFACTILVVILSLFFIVIIEIIRRQVVIKK